MIRLLLVTMLIPNSGYSAPQPAEPPIDFVALDVNRGILPESFQSQMTIQSHGSGNKIITSKIEVVSAGINMVGTQIEPKRHKGRKLFIEGYKMWRVMRPAADPRIVPMSRRRAGWPMIAYLLSLSLEQLHRDGFLKPIAGAPPGFQRYAFTAGKSPFREVDLPHDPGTDPLSLVFHREKPGESTTINVKKFQEVTVGKAKRRVPQLVTLVIRSPGQPNRTISVNFDAIEHIAQPDVSRFRPNLPEVPHSGAAGPG